MTDTAISATPHTPTTPQVWEDVAEFTQDLRRFLDWTHEPKVRRFAERIVCDRDVFHLEVRGADEAAEVFDLLIGTGATLGRVIDGPMSPWFSRSATFGKHVVLLVGWDK